MAGLDLPDVPIQAWEQYTADQFRALTQPVLDRLQMAPNPAIEAIRNQVDPSHRIFVDQAVGAAQRAGIDPVTYLRQIQQESGFNPNAGSNEGAKGIAQFTDATAKGYGIDPYNPGQALDAGARYMATALATNHGDYRLALASYNAGQGNVDRYGQNIFNPAYLKAQGWSDEDANQPAHYIASILGGGAAPTTTPTPASLVQGAGAALGAAAGQVAQVPQQAVQSFKDYSAELLHQFSQSLAPPPASNAGADATRPSDLPTPPSPPQAPDLGGSSFHDWSTNLIGQLAQTSSVPPAALSSPGAAVAGAAGGDAAMPSPALSSPSPGYNDMVGASSTPPPTMPTPATGGTPPSTPAPSFADWSTNLINQLGQRLGAGAVSPNAGPSVTSSGGPAYNDMVGANSNGQGAGQPSLTSLDNAPPGIQAPGTPGLPLLPGPHPIADAVGNVRDAAIGQYNANVATLESATTPRPVGTRPSLADLQQGTATVAPLVLGTLGGDVPSTGGDVTRMYHGTGSAFTTPDGAKFDPSGLFGPGYYLTSDARVASSYASSNITTIRANAKEADLYLQIRDMEELLAREHIDPTQSHFGAVLDNLRQQYADLVAGRQGGPNIRAVNVPNGLKLLNADAPMPAAAIHQIAAVAGPDSPIAQMASRWQQTGAIDHVPGFSVYNQLVQDGSKETAAATLQRAGFDGIRYDGGKRIPLTDDAGQPIQHQAVVIFPESLPKLTNAISGTSMGSPPAVGGAVLGGVYGATQGDTPQERAKNAALGALGGGLAGHVLGGGRLPVGLSVEDASAIGKAPPTVSDALNAAKQGWAQVSQIAKDLHYDVSSHEMFLPMEIDTMEHAPGTVANAQRQIELYNEYTSNVVNKVLGEVRPQIEQLSTEIAGRKEAAYPELTRLGKGLLNDNGSLKEIVPLKQWQSLTGDTRVLAPNALVRQRGTTYVRPEYALDDIYQGEEAAQRFGKSFDNLTAFQDAMAQAVRRDQGVSGQAAQLKELSAKASALEKAYYQALPPATLHDDISGAGSVARPAESPLQGAQVPLADIPVASVPGSERPPTPLAPPRSVQRLTEATGTPAQQAELRPPADNHAANLLLSKFPPEQRAAIQPVADAYGQFAGQRRGVQSDPVAAANARRGLGMSVDDFLKSTPGRAFNNEQIIALGNTAAHYQDQVSQLSQTLEAARRSGTNTPQMEADLLTTSLQANALISVLSGGTAEAGRALRAVQTILTGDYAVSAKASNLAAKRFGVDPAELARQAVPAKAPSVGGEARSPSDAGFVGQGTPTPMPGDARAQGPLPGADAMANGAGSHAQRLAAAYKALGTDGQKFTDWMNAWNMTKADDTLGRYKLLQSLTRPSLMDRALTFGISNMLSSTKTGEIIGMHGAIMALNRPLLTVIRGDPLDAVANVVGQTRSIGSAWSNAVEALKTGVGPTTAAATLRGGNLEVRPDAFPGTAGLVVTPTLRAINAMHEFFRTTATAGALAEAARREALTSGREVADLLANPTPKMLKFADDIAEQALHGGTPSAPAQLILNARNLVHTDLTGANLNAQNVGKVATGLTANLLLPFVKIPDYLYRNGAKIATGPLYYGATTATHALRGETSQAVSDLRMWGVVSLLWGGILGEAIAGNVTGSGPTDPTKLALLKEARDPATGQPAWQAHSTRIPVPGGYRWVDNNVFGPLAVPLNALASAVEAYRLDGIKPAATPTDFMLSVANNTAKSMLDASYIRTAGQFFSAAMQGQAASAIAKTTGANIASRFIPFVSAGAEVARGMDPGVKAPSGPLQQIEARLPVLSRNVPNQGSPYGQPLQNRQDLVSTISPAITSTAGPVNQAANEVARLNQAGQAVNVRVLPATQQKSGGTYEGSPQSAEQIRTVQTTLGQNAQRYIAAEINRPGYQALSDAEKAKTLNRALATADQQANQTAASSLNLDDKHKAALAWTQVPHFTGVSGTPAQVADRNLAIAKAKTTLSEYATKYGSQQMGMYHLMRDDRAALNLALTPVLPASYLAYRKQAIDKKYGGALTKAAQEGLLDANQVLPVGSGG